MAEQTLETQLQEAVARYKTGGDTINAFINGADDETVDTTQGAKPTISKIIKDNQDSIAASRTELDDKVNQASTSAISANDAKVAAEQAKTDTQQLKDDTQALADAINSGDIANNIQANSDRISLLEEKGVETILWEGDSVSGSITVSESLNNFENIRFDLINEEFSNAQMSTFFKYKTKVTNSYAIPGMIDSQYCGILLGFTSDTVISIDRNDSSRMHMRRIVGIK